MIQAQGIVTEAECDMKVREYWSSDSGWNWATLGNKLSSSCLMRLAASTLVVNGGRVDRVRWRYTELGEFTTSSTYKLLHQCDRPIIASPGLFK